MALFTKKKLTDEERQSWSAQLLEVRQAELERYGEEPTLGATWDDHDRAYTELWATEYYPKYGILAWSEMAHDGFYPSGYRKFLFQGGRGGFILLVDELEDAPSELVPGQVIWVVNLGEDEQGQTIYGYQMVSSSWKSAKNYMRDRVKDWDLENTRLGLSWDKFFNWVAVGILTVLTVIALVPIVGGVALGVVLGEAISISGAAAAGFAAVTTAWTAYAALPIDDILAQLGDQYQVDPYFADLPGQVDQGVLVFVGNELTEQASAPINSPSDSSGLGALILAAAGLLIFI
tara:strand:+ start:586 stop:1455 length:870 start_codon:yes stop_codon:yes gene_type:complete